MIWPLDQQVVLNELGDKFLRNVVGAVYDARADLADFREWRPGWFPSMSERCLSNLIHDRVWAHLVARIDNASDVVVHDREPVRELGLLNYRMRIKRHHPGNTISSYPTAAALEFWTQGSMLPGLEVITLGVGYRWIADERKIGPAVISYRDGMDNPIWEVELDEPQDGTTRIGWTPVTRPDLPAVDLYEAVNDDRQDEEGTSR
jgi:hypothetical protein